MVFVVILMIVMTIVVSSWSKKPKSELKIETSEKLTMKERTDDELIEPAFLSEQAIPKNIAKASELETIASSYAEDEEIQLVDKIKTEPIKQKGVIRKESKPQISKPEQKNKIKAESELEETAGIEAVEPPIFEESDLEAEDLVSIEDQPDSLSEQETVGVESSAILDMGDEKTDLSDMIKVEPEEVQKQETISKSENEVEIPLYGVKEILSIEPEKEVVIDEYITPTRRERKPVIDESDPDLKIDLGVETCPHCGSKVPNTIYCIYCGKSLDISDDSNS
jgi:hypothetical protein